MSYGIFRNAERFVRSIEGTRSTAFYDAGNVQGWGAKFPETGWAPLDEIKAGKWARLEPRPVRIFAARFIQVDAWQVPRYFALKAGEFIQWLLAHISPHHKRAYRGDGATAC